VFVKAIRVAFEEAGSFFVGCVLLVDVFLIDFVFPIEQVGVQVDLLLVGQFLKFFFEGGFFCHFFIVDSGCFLGLFYLGFKFLIQFVLVDHFDCLGIFVGRHRGSN
jgi:hypothetical protein